MENSKKHQVHNLVILDESGSMTSIKRAIIKGLNEVVQTIKGIEQQYPEQEHFISFVSFNGLGQKLLHFIDPVSKLEQINDKSYKPDASTPLFDAMGFGINKLKQVLQERTDYNVLVTILTDGEENASKEYSGNDVKKLVEELKLNRWTFTYIGTGHDVEEIASSLSIEHCLAFHNDEASISAMFAEERDARINFSQVLNRDKNAIIKYFKNTGEKKPGKDASKKEKWFGLF
jgi:Mg-chelatase subunit ChlD